MARLTEIEIFDRMQESLRAAEQACRDLATSPIKGPNYEILRKHLGLIEGCCRQASVWREDTRWLPIGMMMAEAHRRAGDWLRGIKLPDGGRRSLAPGEMHPNFVKLAENLKALLVSVARLKTARTGRRGMILPQPMVAPHRDFRPVQVRTPGGVFLP